MISKKLSAFALCGLAAAMAVPGQAQDTTSSTTMSSDTSMSGSMMSNQPMMVSGTVLRYYVDRSGYVTAMDVQTGEGVRMVRFSPGMAQRVYTSYPVGGQISGYVVGSGMGNMMRYDLVGVGDRMPAAGFMPAYSVSDVDLLKSEPYIMAGAKMVQFSGKLRNVITDDMGEVIGLVIGTDKPQNAMGMGMDSANAGMSATDSSMGGGSMGGTMQGGMMGGGMMMNGMSDVLVRVPREFRHPMGGAMGGSMRVTPLFKGAMVEVVGFNEAPRYGVMSAYASRVAASALVVDGRAVGAVGIPKMAMGKGRTLFNTNIGGSSDEEKRASMMGYTTYGASGTMGSGTMEGSGAMGTTNTQ